MLDSRQNILKILSESEGAPMSSRDLTHLLSMRGINVAMRTVRYHLKILDESGMVEHSGSNRYKATHKGIDAIERAYGSEDGFVRNHYINLACTTDIDLETDRGDVVINVVTLSRNKLEAALGLLKTLASTPYMIDSKVLVATEGQSVGGETVPPSMAAIGVVSSASVLGILIRAGIPATPVYMGLTDIMDGQPVRFSSIIGLESVSQDVLSIYLRSRETDVSSALRMVSGKVISMFIEIPSSCIGRINMLNEEHRLVNVKAAGPSSAKLLDLPVGMAKTGVIIYDGINAIAFLEERGVNTDRRAYMTTTRYEALMDVDEALRTFATT